MHGIKELLELFVTTTMNSKCAKENQPPRKKQWFHSVFKTISKNVCNGQNGKLLNLSPSCHVPASDKVVAEGHQSVTVISINSLQINLRKPQDGSSLNGHHRASCCGRLNNTDANDVVIDDSLERVANANYQLQQKSVSPFTRCIKSDVETSGHLAVERQAHEAVPSQQCSYCRRSKAAFSTIHRHKVSRYPTVKAEVDQMHPSDRRQHSCSIRHYRTVSDVSKRTHSRHSVYEESYVFRDTALSNDKVSFERASNENKCAQFESPVSLSSSSFSSPAVDVTHNFVACQHRKTTTSQTYRRRLHRQFGFVGRWRETETTTSRHTISNKFKADEVQRRRIRQQDRIADETTATTSSASLSMTTTTTTTTGNKDCNSVLDRGFLFVDDFVLAHDDRLRWHPDLSPIRRRQDDIPDFMMKPTSPAVNYLDGVDSLTKKAALGKRSMMTCDRITGVLLGTDTTNRLTKHRRPLPANIQRLATDKDLVRPIDGQMIAKMSQTPSNLRCKILQQLVTCEQDFVHQMSLGAEIFSRPLRDNHILPTQQWCILFQNIDKLTALSEYHLQLLMDQNSACLNRICSADLPTRTATEHDHIVGQIYCHKKQLLLSSYRQYRTGLPAALQLSSLLSSSSNFSDLIQNVKKNLSIEEFLNKPIAHLMVIHGHLKNLVSFDENQDISEDTEELAALVHELNDELLH